MNPPNDWEIKKCLYLALAFLPGTVGLVGLASLGLEILGDGTQEKPYLYIDDCIDGILFGLEHSQERVNVLNLGGNSSTSVTTIANMVAEAMGLSRVEFSYTGGNPGWRGDIPQVRFNAV